MRNSRHCKEISPSVAAPFFVGEQRKIANMGNTKYSFNRIPKQDRLRKSDKPKDQTISRLDSSGGSKTALGKYFAK